MSTVSNRPPHRRVLVYRIGQLGDTIIALPAMWTVKKHYPDAHLALLCDRHPGKQVYVLAAELLQGAGLFDQFLTYPVHAQGGLKTWSMLSLLARIRRGRFDTLVYLAPSRRTLAQVGRDRRFFQWAGVKHFVGMEGFHPELFQAPAAPLPALPSESELLLRRLALSGLKAPATQAIQLDLGLGAPEQRQVEAWLARLPSDSGRPWIAIGPGSKMPAKRWPTARFQEVVARLIQEFDLWPVVFGGAEDQPAAKQLIAAWGRGFTAAGELALRPALAALQRCVLYCGNDTGTMHMAAAVNVPCVAIFSARDHPGLWHPIGHQHHILRSQIECEGCNLVECSERHTECLQRISVPQVLEACCSLLRRQPAALLSPRPSPSGSSHDARQARGRAA